MLDLGRLTDEERDQLRQLTDQLSKCDTAKTYQPVQDAILGIEKNAKERMFGEDLSSCLKQWRGLSSELQAVQYAAFVAAQGTQTGNPQFSVVTNVGKSRWHYGEGKPELAEPHMADLGRWAAAFKNSAHPPAITSRERNAISLIDEAMRAFVTETPSNVVTIRAAQAKEQYVDVDANILGLTG